MVSKKHLVSQKVSVKIRLTMYVEWQTKEKVNMMDLTLGWVILTTMLADLFGLTLKSLINTFGKEIWQLSTTKKLLSLSIISRMAKLKPIKLNKINKKKKIRKDRKEKILLLINRKEKMFKSQGKMVMSKEKKNPFLRICDLHNIYNEFKTYMNESELPSEEDDYP